MPAKVSKDANDKSGAPPMWTPEIEAECEREITAIYAARRELGTVGEHLPDELETSPTVVTPPSPSGTRPRRPPRSA